MIHTIIRGYVVAAAVVAVVGCSVDPVRLTDQRVARSEVALETANADPERAALRTLTRAVALALGDSGSRAALKAALRNAPFREHKLEFRKYLSPAVLSNMAQRSGQSSQSLAAALEAVRPLEFYMPVAAHRARWTGGADLLVVSQLLDRDPIVAFNLNGEEVTASRQIEPSVPSLSIVSMETRFDTPLDVGKWQNVDDLGGRAIGTLAPCTTGQTGCSTSSPSLRTTMDCGDNCGGGGGGGSYTPGLYMTFSRIEDRSEDWTRGDPEIEVHVHGPVSTGDTQYGADLACSGEHALPERTFDQNLAFWNGSVLIWSTAEADNFNAQFGDGHHVLFWEDDDTSCVIKLNHNTVSNLLMQTAGAAGAAALKKIGASGGAGISLVLAAFFASAFQNASWLLSDDDFLGALVTESSHGDYWSDANYTLLKGATVNGRANIIGK